MMWLRLGLAVFCLVYSIGAMAQDDVGGAVRYNVAPALQAARAAMAEGDFAKAERLYKMILGVLPKLHPVRLEYAAAARRAGNAERAREILIPMDVDALAPGERSAYRNIKWGEHAFGLSFSPRVMLDSNKNSGPRQRQVRIGNAVFNMTDESMPVDSAGVGASLGGQALWMFMPNFGFGVNGVVDVDVYEDSKYNEFRYDLAAGPRMIMGAWSLRANIIGGDRYIAGDAIEYNIGGQLAATYRLAPDVPLNVSVSRRHYTGNRSFAVSRDRHHTTVAGSVLLRDKLPWEQGNATIYGGYEREDWKFNMEDNRAYRIGGSVELPRNGYVDPVLMFTATRRLYDNPIPIFGKARREWRLEPSIRLDLSVVNTPFGTPYVQYGFVRNKSNVVLTDYDQHRLTAGLVIKAF